MVSYCWEWGKRFNLAPRCKFHEQLQLFDHCDSTCYIHRIKEWITDARHLVGYELGKLLGLTSDPRCCIHEQIISYYSDSRCVACMIYNLIYSISRRVRNAFKAT